MMYSNKFVIAIKVDGKYVREDGDIVRLPFRSEYSIFLKNMESRDAVVSVSIDGRDVLGGKRIIVRANSSDELRGFLENHTITNKFKFIEMTDRIANNRGEFPEDGIIRVEVTYEKEKPIVTLTPWTVYNLTTDAPFKSFDSFYGSNIDCSGQPKGMTHAYGASCSSFSNPVVSCSASLGDKGITEKGHEVNERVRSGYVGSLESNSHVLILRLFGYNVNTVKTTREHVSCKICGKSNKSNNKFCVSCGVYLD